MLSSSEVDEPSGIESVLRQLGVTPVEYEAMLCPYYEIPIGPRKMASWTVLEHGAGCGKDCTAHTADDYLAAINGMLEKGWLAIEGPPTRGPSDIAPGGFSPQYLGTAGLSRDY